MAKLFSITTIHTSDGKVVPPKTIFDASPEDAKDFYKLKAARPVTQEEWDAFKGTSGPKVEADDGVKVVKRHQPKTAADDVVS